MFDFFKRLLAPQREEHHITLPGVELAFNHKLKICFLYEMDSSMPDDRYAAFEAHLAQKHYFLQVIVASVGMPIPHQNEG